MAAGNGPGVVPSDLVGLVLTALRIQVDRHDRIARDLTEFHKVSGVWCDDDELAELEIDLDVARGTASRYREAFKAVSISSRRHAPAGAGNVVRLVAPNREDQS